MTILQKVIISLLLSVFLFTCILAFTYTGFFDFIESRFYNPSVTSALVRETVREAEITDDFLSSLQRRFLAMLGESSVRRSFLPGQYNADMYERSRIFKVLTESVSGLNSVRFVDSGGTGILFSTYPPDIIASDVFSAVYRNYSDDPLALPFDTVDVPSHEQYKLIFHKDEIIFSFPFFDDSDSRMGVALFAVSSGEILDALIATGRLGYNEKLSFYPESGGGLAGIIRGGYGISEKDILTTVAAVSSAAADGRYQGIIPFADAPLALVLTAAEHGFFFGRIVKEDLLIFPQPLKAITFTSIFLTLFLIVFFILSLRTVSGASVGTGVRKTQAPLIVENTDAMILPVENPEPLEPEELESVEEEKNYRDNWVEVESPFSTLLSDDTDSPDFAELESLDSADKKETSGASILSKPFTFIQDVEELLPEADDSGGVIYEQNGIPYINNETIGLKKDTGEKLNNDFEKLVDSVISKSK